MHNKYDASFAFIYTPFILFFKFPIMRCAREAALAFLSASIVA